MLWELGAPCRVQCSINEYLEELFCHHSDLESSLCHWSILLNLCFVIGKRRRMFILEVREKDWMK